MTAPLRLLLIADSDSQLLACDALCRFSTDQPAFFEEPVVVAMEFLK